MSAAERMPPPTVYGMKHSSAVRVATSSIVGRSSWVAVMSRKTTSSAPCLVVDGGHLDRVAGVAQVHEVHAFDDPALVHVEAGYDALHQHRVVSLPSRHRERLGQRERALVQSATGR